MTADELLIEPIAGVDLDAVFKSLNELAPCTITTVFRGVAYPVFLKSSYWRAVSHTVKERDGRRCKVCNRSRFLEAHHRRYDMPRGTEHIHLIDLTTLCGDCHELFHNKVKPKSETKTPKPKKEKIHSRQLVPTPIPDDERIILTRSLIESCKRNGVAFTKATRNALGATDWKKGWAFRLVGTVISRADYVLALEGRDKLNTNGPKLIKSPKPAKQQIPAIEINHETHIVLTKKIIHGIRGITQNTIKALGTDPSKGWIRRLEGKIVSIESFNAAVSLPRKNQNIRTHPAFANAPF